jgi:hypothetical protein
MNQYNLLILLLEIINMIKNAWELSVYCFKDFLIKLLNKIKY